jgi:hypothetical protein
MATSYNGTLNALRAATSFVQANALWFGACALAEDETDRDFAGHVRDQVVTRLGSEGAPAPKVIWPLPLYG